MEKVFDCTNEDYILLRQDIREIEPFDKFPVFGVFIDILFRAALEDGERFGIKYTRGQAIIPAEYYTQDLLKTIKRAGYIDYKKVTRHQKQYYLITVVNFEQKAREDLDDGEMDQFT